MPEIVQLQRESDNKYPQTLTTAVYDESGVGLETRLSNLNSAINSKVSAVNGKGLSTNDYTTAEKNKLSGIAAGAQVNTVTGVKGNSESSYRTGNINITPSNIGLGNVGNFKAVSTVASQGLTDTEKANARANIGAGTSSFSGSYNDLSNKPSTFPPATHIHSYNDLSNKPSLAAVAISGNYNDLSNKPTIPAAVAVKGSAESSYRTGNVNITAANIGLGNVGNFKAVSTVASQGLNNTEKANARANIGAGTSSFSGNYNDLSNKPTSLPASDVPSWAKASTKPTYNGTEIKVGGSGSYASSTVESAITSLNSKLVNTLYIDDKFYNYKMVLLFRNITFTNGKAKIDLPSISGYKYINFANIINVQDTRINASGYIDVSNNQIKITAKWSNTHVDYTETTVTQVLCFLKPNS